MFVAEFQSAQTTTRRRSPRAPVSLDAGLGCGGPRASSSGSRPRIGHVAADVMWVDDVIAGCQFQMPLTPARCKALLTVEV